MTIRVRNEFALILAGNVALVVLIAIGAHGPGNLLAVIRLLLGLVYILYIPGYVLQQALFPRSIDLDRIERTAFSFALSGAIVPPITLLLSALPWGIRLWPIVIALSTFTLICMIEVIIRQSLQPAGAEKVSAQRLSIRSWWAELGRQSRLVYIIIAIVMITASLTAVSILVTPQPAEYFTEFYMLGPEGLAENFPRQAAVGQPLNVTLGITNRERAPMDYRIEVWQVDSLDETHRQLVSSAPSLALQVGETHQWTQSWQPAWAGQDQKFEFLLYTGNDPQPYRQLLLWIDVVQ